MFVIKFWRTYHCHKFFFKNPWKSGYVTITLYVYPCVIKCSSQGLVIIKNSKIPWKAGYLWRYSYVMQSDNNKCCFEGLIIKNSKNRWKTGYALFTSYILWSYLFLSLNWSALSTYICTYDCNIQTSANSNLTKRMTHFFWSSNSKANTYV